MFSFCRLIVLLLALGFTFLPIQGVNAATNVSACGTLSNADTYYVLNQSVSSRGTCFTISANNVTLDCVQYGIQYTITGANASDAYGVYTDGDDNITVKNCIISNFSHAIYLANSSDNALIYYNILNNSINFDIRVVGNNTRIYSNLIFNASRGIVFYGDNGLIYNNTIYNVTTGIITTNFSKNINISYNVMQNFSNISFVGANYSDSLSSGFNCISVEISDSFVHENNCSNSYGFGIVFLGDNNNNNSVYDNRVWNSGGGIEGFFSSSQIFGNVLFDNRLVKAAGIALRRWDLGGNNRVFNNTVYNNINGIEAIGSDYNYIYSNNASYNNNSNIALICARIGGICVLSPDSDSFGNTVVNNILQNSQCGIYIDARVSNTRTNHSIINNFITNASVASVCFIKSSGNVVSDSTLSAYYAGSANDIYSDLASSNTVVNVTFNKSRVFWGDSLSNLTVGWYLGVRVVDEYGSPVSGALVNASDVNGSLLFSLSTDASGFVATQNVTEYFQNSSGVLNYTPHVVSASKNPSNNTLTQLTESKNLVLVLNYPPEISNVRVIDVTQNTVTIGWDSSEPTNETLEYGTTTSYSLIYSNAVFASTHSALITGLTAGATYHYRILACDAAGNCVNSSDYSFTTVGSGGGGGGGGGTSYPTLAPTTTPVTTLVTPTATVTPAEAPSIPPTGAITASPSVVASESTREVACVAGEPRELEIKRVTTVFEEGGVAHTLVNLTVKNTGRIIVEEVRVSDDVPPEFLATVRFINAPASFEGGKAVWFAGALAPSESKSFTYILPGRVAASAFKTPTAFGRVLLTGGVSPWLIALLVVLLLVLAFWAFKQRKKKRE